MDYFTIQYCEMFVTFAKKKLKTEVKPGNITVGSSSSSQPVIVSSLFHQKTTGRCVLINSLLSIAAIRRSGAGAKS
jgi:hypothetical protein